MVHADIKYKYNFIHTSPLAFSSDSPPPPPTPSPPSYVWVSQKAACIATIFHTVAGWNIEMKKDDFHTWLGYTGGGHCCLLTALTVFGMRCVEHSILLIFVRKSLAAFHMHFTPSAMVAADDGWWLHQTHLTLGVLRLCPIAASTSSNIIIFILL